MLEMVAVWLMDVVRNIFLLLVLLPAGLIFLGYVLYIVVQIVRETRR